MCYEPHGLATLRQKLKRTAHVSTSTWMVPRSPAGSPLPALVERWHVTEQQQPMPTQHQARLSRACLSRTSRSRVDSQQGAPQNFLQQQGLDSAAAGRPAAGRTTAELPLHSAEARSSRIPTARSRRTLQKGLTRCSSSRRRPSRTCSGLPEPSSTSHRSATRGTARRQTKDSQTSSLEDRDSRSVGR